MKAWVLFSLTVTAPVFLAAGPSTAAIEPVSNVQAGENGSPPYLLERITVGDYSVTAGSLATGTSIGETTFGSDISHADDLEKLAALEHEQWAAWASSISSEELKISPERLERWKRLIDTPYAELLEHEKDSDRYWARKILEALEEDLK